MAVLRNACPDCNGALYRYSRQHSEGKTAWYCRLCEKYWDPTIVALLED